MTLKPNIPEYINCKGFALAHVVTQIIGRPCDQLNPVGDVAEGRADVDWVCIHVYDDKIAIWSWDDSRTNAPSVSTFAEALDLLTVRDLRIDDYNIEIGETGVQVGCTHVPWNTIEELLKRRPQ